MGFGHAAVHPLVVGEQQHGGHRDIAVLVRRLPVDDVADLAFDQAPIALLERVTGLEQAHPVRVLRGRRLEELPQERHDGVGPHRREVELVSIPHQRQAHVEVEVHLPAVALQLVPRLVERVLEGGQGLLDVLAGEEGLVGRLHRHQELADGRISGHARLLEVARRLAGELGGHVVSLAVPGEHRLVVVEPAHRLAALVFRQRADERLRPIRDGQDPFDVRLRHPAGGVEQRRADEHPSLGFDVVSEQALAQLAAGLEVTLAVDEVVLDGLEGHIQGRALRRLEQSGDQGQFERNFSHLEIPLLLDVQSRKNSRPLAQKNQLKRSPGNLSRAAAN